MIYDCRFQSGGGEVECHQFPAFGKRCKIGQRAIRQVQAVGSGKQPQALQGECGVRERQLLHRQCLHQYQRPRFEPAPVDTPEAGIGKPTDTTPVPDFVVEGMGEQLRRVREEDGLGVAVVAPVDFQLSRTFFITLLLSITTRISYKNCILQTNRKFRDIPLNVHAAGR